MRICLVYDCLFPYTVGGAERWYRALADELAGAGHEVTYLTRRQWPLETAPALAGIRVLAVSPPDELYGQDANRRVTPPLRFGAGVLEHLLRNRRAYDVVHLCAFPFFSLLAARLALAGTRTQIGVDWFEVWSTAYWRGYLGELGGRVGHLVQRMCVLATPRAFVFSQLHADRLIEEGLRTRPIRLSGLLSRSPAAMAANVDAVAEPLVVFAGRHIPEKRAPVVAPAVARARRRIPALRGVVLGDGPERPRVLESIAAHRLLGIVDAPGFVDSAIVRETLARATCLLLPSAREGYGLVLIEAAELGTPTIVVAGPDNAAVELVEEGVNGFLAPSAQPEVLAEAIARAHGGGAALRARTRDWFERHGPALSAAHSAREVLACYEEGARARS